jgi:FkbM family methyltransferase
LATGNRVAIKQALANGLRRVFAAMPPSSALFKFCRIYCNFYTGDNNSDMHTNGEAHAMRRLLPDCRIAFDVGANVGDWAKLALAINPSLNIHCFEPASATFADLRDRNFPAERVTLNPVGLGDVPSKAVLHLHTVSHVNSIHPGVGEGFADPTGTETIELDSLDTYCQRANITAIDYLKIDVEGHESWVLRGAAQMLQKRAIRHVQLEYGTGYLIAGTRLEQVFGLLAESGYTPYKIVPYGLEHHGEFRLRLETFQLSNWIFSLENLT